MVLHSERPVLVIGSLDSSHLIEIVGTTFMVSRASSVTEACEAVSEQDVLVLLDCTTGDMDPLAVCRELKASGRFNDIPIVLIAPDTLKISTMDIFDAGMDDALFESIPDEDLIARLNKSIFHTIANRQLKSRLQQANEMAFSAMSDTSDLGVNIQFLVHCHDCSNVDELGMLLFRTLNHYQVKCSLQIRSEFEVKNLEETGLAKDLEARLLSELRESGRYVDFGRRTVMNYGRVSLLVKNMPEDTKRYGAVKDNVFSLLQGADARVKSIDNSRILEMERDVMRGMAHNMQNVMGQVDERYQSVMKSCATLVEDMAMKVDESIMFLDLTEAQEDTFSDIMQTGVTAINQLFSDGLKIDESFRKLIDYLNKAFSLNGHASVDEMRRLLDRL